MTLRRTLIIVVVIALATDFVKPVQAGWQIPVAIFGGPLLQKGLDELFYRKSAKVYSSSAPTVDVFTQRNEHVVTWMATDGRRLFLLKGAKLLVDAGIVGDPLTWLRVREGGRKTTLFERDQKQADEAEVKDPNVSPWRFWIDTSEPRWAVVGGYTVAIDYRTGRKNDGRTGIQFVLVDLEKMARLREQLKRGETELAKHLAASGMAGGPTTSVSVAYYQDGSMEYLVSGDQPTGKANVPVPPAPTSPAESPLTAPAPWPTASGPVYKLDGQEVASGDIVVGPDQERLVQSSGLKGKSRYSLIEFGKQPIVKYLDNLVIYRDKPGKPGLAPGKYVLLCQEELPDGNVLTHRTFNLEIQSEAPNPPAPATTAAAPPSPRILIDGEESDDEITVAESERKLTVENLSKLVFKLTGPGLDFQTKPDQYKGLKLVRKSSQRDGLLPGKTYTLVVEGVDATGKSVALRRTIILKED